MIPTLAVLNGVAFLAIGLDKRLARSGRRRVPEAWLLLLAVPLAAPGAWTGISVFRHKTQKTSFRMKLLAVTALNVALGVLWWETRRA